MATTFIEAGTAETQDFQFFADSGTDGTFGSVVSSSQAIFGSVRSIQLSSGSGNGFGYARIDNAIADAGTRVSICIRFTGTLSVSNGGGTILNFDNTSNTGCFEIGLTNAGKLVILNSAGTALATGTSVLSASTDYRISVTYTITSTTVNSITVFLNGVTEITATNITISNTGTARLFLNSGALSSIGANVSVYYAHIYIDNQTSGDTGNIRVTAKRPFANGTTNGFTTQIGSGGSGYGSGHAPQVNERPQSDTNGWSIASAGSAITEEYNIEGQSVGDVDITGTTIVDYVGWLRSKALVSETAKIIVNNVQTNISLTSTITLFTKIAGSNTYPAGTGTDIGEISATTVTTVSLYEAGIIVAYIPAPSVVSLGFKSLLGVGK